MKQYVLYGVDGHWPPVKVYDFNTFSDEKAGEIGREWVKEHPLQASLYDDVVATRIETTELGSVNSSKIVV
ncbi:MAG: hypothetical protein AAB518_03815 [Patescibacteria group bacterium]